MTLLRVQGATLPHMTIYLDVANVEAAGYVALSRVRKAAALRPRAPVVDGPRLTSPPATEERRTVKANEEQL